MKSERIIILNILVILLFCFSSGLSSAQDPGVPDTVRLENISGEIGDSVSMPVSLYNDQELSSVTIPLLLDGYSGWVRFDSVSYVGSRLADPTVLDIRQVYVFGTDTFTVDSLLLSFSVFSGDNLPVGTGKLCDLWFTLHFGGEVLVDSLADSPQGGLSLTAATRQSYTPQFSPGLIDISCDYPVGDVTDDGHVDVGDVTMLHKLFQYDESCPWSLCDRRGAGDVNCDRRVDMRDFTYLVEMTYGAEPCTCGTINPSLYDDPGIPDTVWVESETLIVGISSPISIGIINDEYIYGMALGFECDGDALLGLEYGSVSLFCTDRVDTSFSIKRYLLHSNGVNPDTFLFYCAITGHSDWDPVAPGRDAICYFYFIPQSPGTATLRLASWVNAGESMLVTGENAAILPTFYAGDITVIPYLAGDPNHDGEIEVGDVVYLINYLFKDDLPPDPFLSGDATCDGDVTVDDVVYLISYLFKNGPPPEC